ncbi:type II toxin-antitoxin system VapC family toxin [Microbacterium sp.]|uniref:type II toxin-antitoxin system VapC family toxin n=1 Tax=Microbacterium sp. TaxID=51671 RepID=UPI0009294D63|nr:type II toxin-antitoxin system VapC family toxin [Microbacterium sp.]MBN9186352.1 type II toxin-antitoxin system VapC family toxin [Microbacterium sp.]MBN9189747.1 type II toxin-antitoxin system VapC family toxin [Microbacterium sp.]MBN9193297.1 type II toxin-antitoxin system VapC family toxin [Microbacterium sp.]OJU58126.1 MAG: VapC toxin family PIN domain ribonuclease [Microbacterium sp. 70-38]
MIVDTSALIALVKDEPDASAVLAALARDTRPAISAATLLEASIVADGSRDPVRSARFTALLDALSLEVVPFTAVQAAAARHAYREYGRGSGHPARLNLGDCFAYALATERHEPLLYVGDDFARTDVRSALPRTER